MRQVGSRGAGLVVIAEQFVEYGGVARIVEAVMTGYPDARLVVSDFDPVPDVSANECEARLQNRRIEAGIREPARVHRVSQRGRRSHFLAPLYARRMRGVPLEQAAAVLSLGTLGWTLAPRIPAGARHIGYVGGEPRPYYGRTAEYASRYPKPVRAAIAAALPALRSHHRRMLMRPHRLATNSVHSARQLGSRIARPVDVLYPPVRTDFFTPADRERRHFLVVSRLQPHKRLEVIVEAFRRLREPVVIAGAGPAGKRLALDAPSNLEFVGHVGDAELRELYRASLAVVSGSIEEFGLCLAEAQAAGTPVIAPRAGGSGEIVRDGETGLLLDPVDSDSIVRAARRLRRTEFDPESCRRAAERFSEERFLRELQDLIEPASKLTS